MTPDPKPADELRADFLEEVAGIRRCTTELTQLRARGAAVDRAGIGYLERATALATALGFADLDAALESITEDEAVPVGSNGHPAPGDGERISDG